jgi:hypothetical protein
VYNFLTSYPFFLSFPFSYWNQPSSLGRTCSAFLFYDFVEEKRKDKKNNMIY